jgi:transposase
MKLQDVILRAIAKKITWLDAADIAGVSARTIVRIREKYEQYGYDGLYDQQHRKRYVHRVPLPTAEKVLALYQESYSGLNVLRFHQKLQSEHGIRVSYSWVKQALLGAGLVAPPVPSKKPREFPREQVAVQPPRRRIHFVRSSA